MTNEARISKSEVSLLGCPRVLSHSSFGLLWSLVIGHWSFLGVRTVSEYWPHFTLFALLEIGVTVSVIVWILMTKRDSTAAMAWCLIVVFVPLVGASLF